VKRIKNIFTVVHIVLWVLFSLLIALQLSQEDGYWLNLTVAVVLTALYVFYSHFLLLTRSSGKRRNRAYFVRFAGIMVTGPLLYIILHPKSMTTADMLSEYYFVSLFSLTVPFLFLSWLARTTENLVLNTIMKEQLEKQAVKSELYYLKSQINPHFLFNTLNNIHTLVYKQAATAPEAVLRLSSLMRYMIYESNASVVPLLREITYLNDYISLQQLRYKQTSVAYLEIAGSIDNLYVAPLLFIHFLENAYKHSPARLQPGDIQVKVEISENAVIFKTKNPVVKKHETVLEEPGGIGLPNIRKRLQLLYPNMHSLEISNDTDTYSVVLRIYHIHRQLHEKQDYLPYN
jgi:sensor histidine kinase YesM